jgi:hypothetical protein
MRSMMDLSWSFANFVAGSSSRTAAEVAILVLPMELAKRGDAGILTARAARTLRVGADCVQASIALVHSAPTPSCK